jgi:hypothetical protein
MHFMPNFQGYSGHRRIPRFTFLIQLQLQAEGKPASASAALHARR